MFKDKITKLKKIADTITTNEIKSITGESNVSNKSTYTKSITRLKRGLYSLNQNLDSLKVANVLVTPSYLSLETVLSYYSIIPDAVVSYTSITTKLTNSFHNKFGTFYYSNIKQDYYFGYNYRDGVFIADKEKALLDYFYLKSKQLRLTIYDYENIDKKLYSSIGCRNAIKWFREERFENLDIINFGLLKRYGKKMNKKVYYMALLLIKYYEENEKKYMKIV